MDNPRVKAKRDSDLIMEGYQYLFVCTKCKQIVFDTSFRAFCPICDREMPCLGYIPQCKIDEVRNAIELWWRV